jgi:hypothetical protein
MFCRRLVVILTLAAMALFVGGGALVARADDGDEGGHQEHAPKQKKDPHPQEPNDVQADAQGPAGQQPDPQTSAPQPSVPQQPDPPPPPGKHPGDKQPGGKQPGGKHPGGKHPGDKHPGGKHPGGKDHHADEHQPQPQPPAPAPPAPASSPPAPAPTVAAQGAPAVPAHTSAPTATTHPRATKPNPRPAARQGVGLPIHAPAARPAVAGAAAILRTATRVRPAAVRRTVAHPRPHVPPAPAVGHTSPAAAEAAAATAPDPSLPGLGQEVPTDGHLPFLLVVGLACLLIFGLLVAREAGR